MTDSPHHRDEDERLDEATRAMLGRLRECYRPSPLEPARRAALERGLARRLEQPRLRLRMGAPLLAVAVAAAATLVWLRLPAAGPADAPAAVPVPAAAQPIAAGDAQADSTWVAQLFDPPELGEAQTVQDRSLYPPDLAAIDVAFLGN